jgi:hypothetical protein
VIPIAAREQVSRSEAVARKGLPRKKQPRTENLHCEANDLVTLCILPATPQSTQ